MGNRTTTVYVDAMGGDLAPKVNVRGAVVAAQEKEIRIVLIGDEQKIKPLLAAELKKVKNTLLGQIEVHHTDEWIKMDDHPSMAVRQKKTASLNIAMKLAAENPHSAFLSAGNSGAALASGVLYMKRIPGVDRPAIAATLPTTRGHLLLLDAGANIQCKPLNLVQFALLGSTFYRYMNPDAKGSVGLLSNGGEDSKGNDLIREANVMLKSLQDKGGLPPDTYVGYVEGGRLFHGIVDVVICDGFTGNIVLKSLEGLAQSVVDMMKMEIKRDWLAAIGMVFALRALKKLKQKTDYAEVGGAPLIGLDGHAFIAHGRSNVKAIKNGILRAATSANTDLPRALSQVIEDTNKML